MQPSFCSRLATYQLCLGYGLHLKVLAQKLPEKHDLHEPHRLLSSLDEYKHLRRILRLCTVHIYRNIRKAAVPEVVCNDMRSLVSLSHPDWEGTISRIERDGGQPGISMYSIFSCNTLTLTLNETLTSRLGARQASQQVCIPRHVLGTELYSQGGLAGGRCDEQHYRRPSF